MISNGKHNPWCDWIPGLAVYRHPGSMKRGCLVGVVDTGCDYRHVLLHQSVSGGFIENENVITDTMSDPTGHGTSVCGIISAEPNGYGPVGINPDISIFYVRVTDTWGNARQHVVAQGIKRCVDHGCKIINVSLGNIGHSIPITAACKYAQSQNVCVLFAGANRDDEISYENEHSATVYVVDRNKDKIPNGAMLYLYSTYPGNICRYVSGASYSVPIITSIMATLYMHNNQDATPDMMLSWVDAIRYSNHFRIERRSFNTFVVSILIEKAPIALDMAPSD